MTARTTYEAAVLAAGKAKLVSDFADEMTRQTTIDAQNTVVGYAGGGGSYASLASAIATAQATALKNGLAREATKQIAIAAARDTLRDTGDRSAP